MKESFQEARGFAKLSKECVCGGGAGGGSLYVRYSLSLRQEHCGKGVGEVVQWEDVQIHSRCPSKKQ